MALSGDRSPLFYWGGGAAKPLSTGTYAGPRGLLAFWLGGANFRYALIPPIPPQPPISDVVSGGLPARYKRRIDDEEIFEFLQIWTLFNDNE